MWMISARLPSSFLGQFTNTRWKHLVEHDPGSRSSWAWIRSVGHQVQQAREVCFHTSHLKKFSSDNFCASFFAGVSKILCVIQLELCLSREMPSHLLFLLLLYSGNLFFSNPLPMRITLELWCHWRFPPCASICSSCVFAPLHAATEVKSIYLSIGLFTFSPFSGYRQWIGQ